MSKRTANRARPCDIGSRLPSTIAIGMMAGAAGTVALNVSTYVDMAVRGRGASSAPSDLIGEAASRAGIESVATSNQSEPAGNRRSGLGALAGYVTGLGSGALYGLLRGLGLRIPVPAGALALAVGAMTATDAPLAGFRVSDPRSWTASEWASDGVPHLVYGTTTALVYERVTTKLARP